MTVRTKMTVAVVEKFQGGLGRVRLACAVDNDGVPEADAFTTATPSGAAEFVISNPAAFAAFEPGDTFFVDFTPVPKPVGLAAANDAPAEQAPAAVDAAPVDAEPAQDATVEAAPAAAATDPAPVTDASVDANGAPV